MVLQTWNTVVPGHYNLDKAAEYVKNGIYAGGGTPVEFSTIAACDGVAQGREGMHYILPSREIICNSVEIMAQAHRLDGLVRLTSWDKIVPAMLMAAARLDIPCIVCVGGPILGGIEFDGRKSDMTSISEALGMVKADKITECEYAALENTTCPGCGSCSFCGTANTMCCVPEALGMSLPGSALIPAAYAARLRSSFEAGRTIVNLCKKGITARQIMTPAAIRNAIKVTMATCGSTNAVLHLSAIANEAELDMNVMEEFEKLSKTTPQIAKVNPAAKPEMEAFFRAGGIPKVEERLGDILDTSVMTVSGKTLKENLAEYVYEYPENPEIIKTVEEPFSKTGGVAVLHGNLGRLMMTYPNVYVASVAMGANPGQLMKAVTEAVDHKGPSIIIAYAPCINHGIKAGMNNVQAEMKKAVDCGLWPLYRYNPDKAEKPFYKQPSVPVSEFLNGEVRYAGLKVKYPEIAEKLFSEAQRQADERYKTYVRLEKSYNEA